MGLMALNIRGGYYVRSALNLGLGSVLDFARVGHICVGVVGVARRFTTDQPMTVLLVVIPTTPIWVALVFRIKPSFHWTLLW